MLYSELILSHASLVGFWKEKETSGTTANDSSTFANHGTFTGTYTLGALGPIPNEYLDWSFLSDTSPYGSVQIPDQNQLDLGDGPFSLELWAKRLATGFTANLLSKGTNAYHLRYSTDSLELRKQGVGNIVTATVPCADTEWHYLACTRAGDQTTKLYVDGADATGTVTQPATPLANTSTILAIGAAGTGNNFRGNTAKAAIYSAVLTPAEVLERWQTGIAGWRTQRFVPRQAVNRAAVM